MFFILRSKLFRTIAIIIVMPPKKTLVGGISLINNQTQRGANTVSVSISNPIVNERVVLEPIVIQIKPKVSCGTPNKKPKKTS